MLDVVHSEFTTQQEATLPLDPSGDIGVAMEDIMAQQATMAEA